MIDRSDLDDRIAKCNKILDTNPGSQIFAALADAHRKKGELDKAFRICQNGLKVHPKYGSAHMVMAKVNMDKGLYDWAEAEVEKAIELDGITRASELLLSEIYIYKGEFNKACRLLEKLNQADPDNEHITKLLEIARKIPLDAVHGIPEPEPPAPPPVAPQPIETVENDYQEPGIELLDSPIAVQPDMNFKKMLKALISMPDIEGALIVRPDGLVVEAEWNVPGETDLFGALTAEAAKQTTLQMRESGFGNLESMLIETANTITYMAAAKGKILAVVCSETVNLGSLKLKLATLMPRLSA